MSRAPINSGRYVPVVVNGQRQWTRDQVALQADILSLLQRDGNMPKKRIIMTLSTAQAAIETALSALLDLGKIERYRAMSIRRRMDEHWCIVGATPMRAAVTGHYKAIEILAAMQAHAAAIYAGSANK